MNLQEATFGAGCFWCIEACFSDLKGVQSAISGFSNGHTQNPTYKEVCTETTGHAEVVRITFDADEISYDELLRVFFFVHNPTQLNRQGNDMGKQYRSGIYFHNEEQKTKAELYKANLTAQKAWDKPIVTEIVAIDNYWPAEDYHQNYLALNPENPYCAAVSRPKYEKFKAAFADILK